MFLSLGLARRSRVSDWAHVLFSNASLRIATHPVRIAYFNSNADPPILDAATDFQNRIAANNFRTNESFERRASLPSDGKVRGTDRFSADFASIISLLLTPRNIIHSHRKPIRLAFS